MFTDMFDTTAYYYIYTGVTEFQSSASGYLRHLLSVLHCESYGLQEKKAQSIEKSWLYQCKTVVDKELPVSLGK